MNSKKEYLFVNVTRWSTN